MTVNQANCETVTLGKYKVVRELGRGSMGIVYEGFDPVLGRQVALKTIRKDLLQLGAKYEADNILQRFRREAQAAARLNHPNIVVVYDYAEEGDTVFIAMEMIRGRELEEFFRNKQRFDLKTALDIMGQLLDGLAYSHQYNIVHRDIKPANIILLDGGVRVKIADFGIARIDTSELTQTGEVMGTPTHMAPEQLLGKQVDGRADLFSAGVILYQLLTGEKPFIGSNITAVMHSVLNGEPAAPTRLNPKLPPQCDAIVGKALAKNADERYQNAEEFKAALIGLRKQMLAARASMPIPAQAATPASAPPALPTAAAQPNPPAVRKTLEEWVAFLTKQELPIFSHTALRINRAMSSSSAGAMELGRIIQQDPTLTAKLLKLGNSPYYNPSRQKLPNINRAIIILGIKNIHNLAIACSYMESAASRHNSEEINRLIANSLHAAVQAKAFAILAGDPFPEEVFVAALMNNFGRVAFWCYGQDACVQIRQLTASGIAAQEAEQRVLGFTLRELEAALCKAWQLGGLIEECIGDVDASGSYRTKLVHYSHKLVEELEKGLDSAGVQDSLDHIGLITQKTAADLEPIAVENAGQAVAVAAQLGAGSLAQFIVTPVLVADEPALAGAGEIFSTQAGSAIEAASATGISSVDHEERIRVLQDISNMLNGPIDISALFEKAMEGMQKIIAMDRVMFALIAPNRATLREKSSKGMGGEYRKSLMEFDIRNEKNIFSFALAEHGGSWIIPQRDELVQKFFTPSVRSQLGQNECFAMPITINKTVIGLFYADRGNSDRPLDRGAFNVFVELVQQANIGMNLSTKKTS